MERFDLDPSRPYQLKGGFLAIWLPRGRGRDDRAEGLLLSITVCANGACACTEALVTAIPIDDRAAWAKHDRRGIKLSWRDTGEREPPVGHALSLDFLAGVVTGPHGDEVPSALAPFFREPIPSWVLDDIFAEWMRGRPLVGESWLERALQEWRPGTLLSTHSALPDDRPDMFVHDGERYVVDFVFDVEPGAPRTANRFVLLEVRQTAPDEQQWTEIGSFGLDEQLTPRDFHVADARRQTLIGAYLGWRARSGNPRARFDDLRARTMARGADLRAHWDERERKRRAALPAVKPVVTLAPAPSTAGPPRHAGKPGRNDPCPCGSGKKHKRCCAA